MFEMLLADFESKYPGKAFLTIDEAAQALDCPKRIVYNWIRRADPKMRPPIIQSGKWIRIPVRAFIQWLVKDQYKLAECNP